MNALMDFLVIAVLRPAGRGDSFNDMEGVLGKIQAGTGSKPSFSLRNGIIPLA